MGPTPTAYDTLKVVATADQEVVVAAYRALARLFHPDRSSGPRTERTMAELNAAYALVRSPELRARYDRELRSKATATIHRAVGPAPAAARYFPPRSSSDTTAVIDFGRYAGYSLQQVARVDPDYLRWLRRHSAGVRFRAKIDTLVPTASAA